MCVEIHTEGSPLPCWKMYHWYILPPASFTVQKSSSKTCHYKLGQYHLALLNSPQEEAYEHLFKGLLSYLGLERSLENLVSLFPMG